jgi:aspartyl aminopeptidase
MIGAHTDSPTLRIKPVSKKTNAGFLQVGVETYGGGIWHTWFDRDLSVAGRVMVREGDGKIGQRLVKVERPILRIPTLAIHLDRSSEFAPNKETELFPIAGLVAAELNRVKGKGGAEKDESIEKLEKEGAKADEGVEQSGLKALSERHHPYLLDNLAEHADVEVSQILDFECVLYDTQPACIGGLNNELIFSARLDNLNMTYCAVSGLISSLSSEEGAESLKKDETIRLIACFDHEEIGSLTAQGAASNLLPSIIRRLSAIPSSPSRPGEKVAEGINETAYEQSLSKSFLISADMAHSVNPNYAHKYEADHRPVMNGGPVLKVNANARYATNAPGIVLMQECARLAASLPALPSSGSDSEGKGEPLPLQVFVVRNDSPCGGTIGPMLAAALGTRTLDMGNPQLSMHSIRECGGVEDVRSSVRLFESFFRNFGSLGAGISVD